MGFLNHVELVYRPGARERVASVFETLGCHAIETGGPYLVIQLDEKDPSFLDNVLYVSEVTAEQWSFEEALTKALREVLRETLEPANSVGSTHRPYASRLQREPQRTSHFGIRVGSEAELDGILAAIDSRPPAADGLCELEVAGVFRPGDPGALSDTLIQAFVRTELCAAGLISLGQHIELQVALSGA